MSSIRLFIVEDQPIILKNQLKMLQTVHDITVVGTALNGEDAITSIEKIHPLPDVILCDIGLPKMSGTEVARYVRLRYPSVEVLMFTVFDEEDRVLEAIQAGASGYLLKGADVYKVVDAIREVHQGGSVIQPSLARKMLRHFHMPLEGKPPSGTLTSDRQKYASVPQERSRSLTERELECLQMIAKGLSNNEAAGVLGLSKATIRTHLEHIYQKLDVTNRVEAVTEGIRQGIIEI